MAGVVFLDENDEKMILVKATGRVLKLSQCGIAVDKRFAFYDQIVMPRSYRATTHDTRPPPLAPTAAHD